MAMAQVSRITGVVVSAEDNEPIVGASVLEMCIRDRKNHPLKGVYQMIKLIVICVGVIIIVSTLICLLYTSRCV